MSAGDMVHLPQDTAQSDCLPHGIFPHLLKLDDRKVVISLGGCDLSSRPLSGLNLGQQAALQANDIFHVAQILGFQRKIGLLPERGGENRDSNILRRFIHSGEHIRTQLLPLAGFVKFQHISANDNAALSTLKLPIDLCLVAVYVLNQPNSRCINGYAILASVHAVCNRCFQPCNSYTVHRFLECVLIRQIRILRQLCERHTLPKSAFAVGSV